MSVTIGIKENGKVYLAADSQCSLGNTKRTISNPNNFKIWKTKGLNNSIMTHTGACKDLGVIRYKRFIPETLAMRGDIDIEFVQGRMVYDMFDALDERGFTDKEDGPSMNSSFLFAYEDKLYDITASTYVFEIDDYVAKGSGRDSAMGSLSSTVGEEPEIRLIKAVMAAKNVDLAVGYPIIVTDTEKCEYEVYEE